MKTTFTLTALAAFTMLFQACEKQNWSETKMFHDVPKRVSDDPAAAAPTAPATPTSPANTPAHPAPAQ